MRSVFALALLPACFSPMPEPLVVDQLDFENAHTQFDDIKITPFFYDGLTCPDGTSATLYAVYRAEATEPAPVVLVFHGGSFDYVVAPDTEDPLAGPHYQADNRLTGDWASRKVFETLAMIEGDGPEVNDGTLPAALANAGAVALYPANCWGDLWHNEYPYEPNIEGEGFFRNGRALAWATTALFSADQATRGYWRERLAFELPVPTDDSAVSFVGLGEGGRAIPELLRRSQFVASVSGSSSAIPPIRGIAIDSTMDNLYPVYVDDAAFGEYNAGLDRVFPDAAGGDIGQYSLQRWINERGLPGTNLNVVWSSADPQVPVSTLSGLVALDNGGTIQTVNTGEAGHIFANNDMGLARELVDRLLLR